MNELNDLGDLVLCFHMLSDVSRKVYTQIQRQTIGSVPLCRMNEPCIAFGPHEFLTRKHILKEQ